MRVTGLRSLAKRKYLSVALRTNKSCSATVRAPNFKRATARLEPGRRTVVRLRRTKGKARRFKVTVNADGRSASTLVIIPLRRASTKRR
jgi:hypothetical protein